MRTRMLGGNLGWEAGRLASAADTVFVAGLVLMILALPISEALKNVGYFLALGGWVVKRGVGPGFRIAFTPIGICLALYFFASLLSAAAAIDRWEGFRGAWDVFRPLSLFLVMLNDIESAPRVRLCLGLFVTSTAMGVAWGLFDYFSQVGRFGQGEIRLEVLSLGHPNHTATYLVIMLGLLLSVLFLGDWPVRGKLTLGAVTGATLLALVLTYSRGGWIAFFACLLFLSLSLKQWKPIVGIVVLGVAILGTLEATGKLVTWRVASLARITQDGNFRERLQIWNGALRVLQDRPVLGVGPRNFKNLDHRRYDLRETDHAHGLFFTVAAERGLLGLLLLVAFFVCYAYQGMRRRPLPDGLRGVTWHAAMASGVAIVAAGMANTTLHSEGAMAFASLTALMLAPGGAGGHFGEGRP